MKSKKTSLLLAATLLLASAAQAQAAEPDSPTLAEASSRGPQGTAPSKETIAAAPNILTGYLLTSNYSPLHWGRLSAVAFSANQYYDFNYAFNDARQSDARATTLSSLLVYSLHKHNIGVDLQYRPSIWFTDSGTETDFGNQLFDAHTAFRMRRWTLVFSDSFRSVPYRGAADEGGLISNAGDGTLIRNPFLAAGQRVNDNEFTWSNQYQWSERDTLSLNFNQVYQQSSLGAPQSSVPVFGPGSNGISSSAKNFGGSAGWSHQYSSHTDAYVTYTYSYALYGPITASSQWHSITPGFSHILGHDFRVAATVGYTYGEFQGPNFERRLTRSYVGSATLQKAFRHSEYAFSWARGRQFSGLISDSLNDNFNVSASRTIFRRLNASIQGGYVMQHITNRAGIHSWMGNVTLGYAMTRHWSWTTSYQYLGESGLLAEPYQVRQLISFGPRWSWGGQESSR